MADSKSERLKRQRQQRGGVPPTALELLDAVIGNPPATIEPSAITVAENGAVQVGHFILSPVGMQITDDVNRDEWIGIFTAIQHIQSAVQWIIGDWLVYGVHREWGKTYDDFAVVTGYKPQTLHNFAWVAGNIQFSLRNEKLSFNHHYLVAGMSPEDQEKWLGNALKNGWSVARLRDEIMGERPTLPRDIDRFTRFLAQNRAKFTRFGKKFRKVGQGEKSQISQMIDEEIAYLEDLKQRILNG